MHTDVGGGYDIQELSDIPLEWMLDMAQKHGLRIYENHGIKLNKNANGHMHNSRGSFLTGLYRKKQRFWPPGRTDKPIVHKSVLERTKGVNNEDEPPYAPWILKLDPEQEPAAKPDTR